MQYSWISHSWGIGRVYRENGLLDVTKYPIFQMMDVSLVYTRIEMETGLALQVRLVLMDCFTFCSMMMLGSCWGS